MFKYLKLSNSIKMPMMGLGTHGLIKQNVEPIVERATKLGYRYFDCAWVYKNEKEIGKAVENEIKSGRIKRKDLFMSSKLWSTFNRQNLIPVGFQESLDNLRLDYLDLFLIHFPISIKPGMRLSNDSTNDEICDDIDILEIWKGLEKLVDSGKVKSIGLSNFNISQVQYILKNCRIKPVVNQVEIHAYFPNKELVNFCQQNKVQAIAFSPLGGTVIKSKDNEILKKPLDDPEVLKISKNLNATSAQILLNYINHRNLPCVPRTNSLERLEENLKAMEIRLSEKDFQTLDQLDINTRFFTAKVFKTWPNYPFKDD